MGFKLGSLGPQPIALTTHSTTASVPTERIFRLAQATLTPALNLEKNRFEWEVNEQKISWQKSRNVESGVQAKVRDSGGSYCSGNRLFENIGTSKSKNGFDCWIHLEPKKKSLKALNTRGNKSKIATLLFSNKYFDTIGFGEALDVAQRSQLLIVILVGLGSKPALVLFFVFIFHFLLAFISSQFL